MSSIINALFGTFSAQSDEQNSTTDKNQTVTEQSTTASEHLHTSAAADNVQVQSVISSETQANATINTKLNIENLLLQLGTTYAQVNEYSRARVAEINELVQKSIADVLTNTQHQQEELLSMANRRHLIIDNEYKNQLKNVIQTLDAVKAKTLADLEHDLQTKQQTILNEAKKQIDILNNQANTDKVNALIESQLQNKTNIDNLTDQILEINQQETQHLLESTTTTIITSHAQAATNTQIQSQGSVKGIPDLTTTTISSIDTAANVTLSSNAIESVIANARARCTNNTTTLPANNSMVDPIITAANVILGGNAIESIVTPANEQNKTNTVNAQATVTDITHSVNPIAILANVALNSNVIDLIVTNARERSKNIISESVATTNQ
ncbi:hypothetical protein I4U23_015596 [Adineta vaga]|nr:hypothetical protein I4U23_015596 [Adineta vaga]